jgi:hypothetical protein
MGKKNKFAQDFVLSKAQEAENDCRILYLQYHKERTNKPNKTNAQIIANMAKQFKRAIGDDTNNKAITDLSDKDLLLKKIAYGKFLFDCQAKIESKLKRSFVPSLSGCKGVELDNLLNSVVTLYFTDSKDTDEKRNQQKSMRMILDMFLEVYANKHKDTCVE